MSDFIHALSVATGSMFIIFLSSVAFTTGMAVVCRRMKWSPVNITINVNDNRECAVPPADSGK